MFPQDHAEGGNTSTQEFHLSSLVWSLEEVTLDSNEIKVFAIPLDQPPLSQTQLFNFLTADERERADRFKVSRARHQFVITRGLLRQMLGNLLSVSPETVPIVYTAVGKPVLEGPSTRLHFNVTHTDGLALLAFAHCPLGVDVERIRTLENPEGLVTRFFSKAEQAEYFSLDTSTRLRAFFRGWTSKEALIKAAGTSVAYLDEFAVRLDPEKPASLLVAQHPNLIGKVWGLEAWEPRDGYVAALAIEGQIKTVHVFKTWTAS